MGICAVKYHMGLKNTITDGGSTATHLKAKSGWIGRMDWILLRKLVLVEYLAVLIIMDDEIVVLMISVGSNKTHFDLCIFGIFL